MDQQQDKATAGDFLRLGVLLAGLRSAMSMPLAMLARRECPNCGPGVPMLKEKLPGDQGHAVCCTKCGYRTTENPNTGGLA